MMNIINELSDKKKKIELRKVNVKKSHLFSQKFGYYNNVKISV